MYKLYLNPIADGKYRSLPTVIPEFQHWVSRLYGYEPVTDALYPNVLHENNQFIVIEGETHAAQFLFIETGNKILHLP